MCVTFLSAAADVVDFLEYTNITHILEKVSINAIMGNEVFLGNKQILLLAVFDHYFFPLTKKAMGTVSALQFGLTLSMTKKVALNKRGLLFYVEFILW